MANLPDGSSALLYGNPVVCLNPRHPLEPCPTFGAALGGSVIPLGCNIREEGEHGRETAQVDTK